MRIPVRNPLFYSLLVNGILAGNLALRFLTASPQPKTQSSPGVPVAPAPDHAITPHFTPPPAQAPFQWSSLESDDYSTYIANLRKIGCPEQTIRDLIAAELEGLYTEKAAEIRSRSDNTASLAIALAALETEKSDLLTQLLEVRRNPDPIASGKENDSPELTHSPSPKPSGPSPANTAKADLPLIFYPLAEGNLKLTAQQQAQIKVLQQTFVDDIGGPNQNPDDPKYLQNWETASALANERIGTMLGQDFYQEYQRAPFGNSGQ